MKLYCAFLFFIVMVFALDPEDKKTGLPDLGNNWNGSVSLHMSKTGPDIIISEWKMEGTFTNSRGPFVHSSKYQYKDGVGEIKRDCLGTGEARVEVNINETGKLYTIMVHGVPECKGKTIEYGATKEFSIPGGDTTIYIPDQPLGNSSNVLSGTITLKSGPLAEQVIQTHVFKWNLSRTP
ncbi:MAG: hypothetical protein ACT4OJ_03745 [Bacteroidota bacterium]